VQRNPKIAIFRQYKVLLTLLEHIKEAKMSLTTDIYDLQSSFCRCIATFLYGLTDFWSNSIRIFQLTKLLDF